eukprot:CAMPEP_0168343210 /NCGR_PEP_ID=MMETSP0213-20121227/15919_1 /TAXON_ID=151035 /ORGANISM="Euplotes harpa, Strain FSP1.4" /LENGTH=154 /DNA_ID=CAMNT_0008350385 /DNA_START=15 /DNA_END=475 /DNA_ORIENTATION=+
MKPNKTMYTIHDYETSGTTHLPLRSNPNSTFSSKQACQLQTYAAAPPAAMMTRHNQLWARIMNHRKRDSSSEDSDGWGHREYKVKKQKLLKKIISRRINKKNKTEGVLEKIKGPVKVENEGKRQDDVNRTVQTVEESKGMVRNEHLKVNSVSPT